MTHETIADILFVTLTLATMAGCAVKASAGSPGPQTDAGVYIETIGEASALSPAEIRNAAIVEADRLEAKGVEVDRTFTYGIGLDR
ncbi:MAG: hypothetical protein AAFP97_10980 [Pseudomonadota bacterium]